mgnify:CR=1 FL=1
MERHRTRNDVLKVLEEHRASLRALGARRLGLFGSTARDEAGPTSDLDFVVELDDAGTQATYVVIDPVGGLYQATDVDPDGVVIRLGPADLRLDNAAGPVATLARPEAAPV